MKFRKKPVVVQAVLAREAMRCAVEHWNGLPPWLAAAYERGEVVFGSDRVHINTLEGRMTAQPDDWIIQGTAGELYPCKPAIFAATYEAVDEDPAAAGFTVERF